MQEANNFSHISGFESFSPAVQDLFRADRQARDCFGHSPTHLFVLYYSLYHEAFSHFVYLGFNLEIEDFEGRTPLLLAVIHCKRLMLKHLIDGRANVNARDNLDQNALHYMALPEMNHVTNTLDLNGAQERLNKMFPILETLLKQGIDVNLKNHKNETPLMLAAGGNHLKIVEMLLKYGADVESQSETLKTCLHFASISTNVNATLWAERNSSIIFELIRNGASVNVFDRTQTSPLGYILMSRHPNAEHFANQFLAAACLANWRERINFNLHARRTLGLFRKDRPLLRRITNCYLEINEMRDIWVLEGVLNLCQFALKGVSQVQQNMKYVVSARALNTILERNFPIYHNFILSRFEKWFLRQKFMNLSITTRGAFEIRLFEDEKYMIASYFNASELFEIFRASRS